MNLTHDEIKSTVGWRCAFKAVWFNCDMQWGTYCSHRAMNAKKLRVKRKWKNKKSSQIPRWFYRDYKHYPIFSK